MKKLYVPGRIWLDVNTFTKEFPQTVYPLYVIYGYGKSSTLLQLNTVGTNSIFSSELWEKWEKKEGKGFIQKQQAIDLEARKTLTAYRDIIRFALTPEYPLEIQVQLKELSSMQIANAIGMDSNCKNYWGKQYDPRTVIFAALAKAAEYCYNVYKDKIVNYTVANRFSYFEAKSQSEWMSYNEVYGISNISQVPANTIAYTVVNQPPPVPADIKWDNVDFWSKVFEDSMGISILSAVAKNLPVKIKTRVENWKDPNIHLAAATTKKTKDLIIHRYTYVWQDFDIEVDEKNSILVKYNRDIKTETQVSKIDKSSAWMEILKGVGFLVASAAIFMSAGALLAPTAGAAPIPSAATGIGAAVPSAGAGVSATLGGPASFESLMAVSQVGAGSVLAPAAVSTIGTGVGALFPAATVAIPAVETVSTATVAGSGVFTKVLTVTKVAAAVAKAGAGMWSQAKKDEIAQTMKSEGIDESYLQYIPDGMTSDGNFVYKKSAAVTEIDFTKLALIGGGAILLMLLMGGGEPQIPATYYPASTERK